MIQAKITSPEFFSGGNAHFTVSNGKTHYTYRIRSFQGHDGRLLYSVGLLTGSDNNFSYTYIGMYYPDTHVVLLTSKSKMNEDSQAVAVLRWALHVVAEKRPIPDGYSILHDGKCCRCGRKLTTPESVLAGIGPECSKIQNGRSR